MKKILITGGFGFVGSNLAQCFMKQGYHIALFDLPDHPLENELNAWLRTIGPFSVHSGDIRDYNAITAAVQGADIVIHVAALLNSVAPWQQFRAINVQGTDNVCKACIEHQVQNFILVSTSDVFGIPTNDLPITEDSQYHPWNEPYADTKIEAANLVKQYRDRGKLNASIVYPGWVYGEGDRQFFPAVTEMVKGGLVFTWEKAEPLQIYLVHIDDVVNGIYHITTEAVAKNQDYLLLDDNSGITPLALYQEIASFYQCNIRCFRIPYTAMIAVAFVSQKLAQWNLVEKPLLSTTDVKAFGNRFRFSTLKARTDLGWTISVSNRVGIQRALEWQQNVMGHSNL